jgi:excisionase family DNA binding protein
MNMKGKDVARTPLYAVPSRLMTVRDLSEYLHVHISTIYRMLRQREIPAFRIGSDWRFNIESVDRWCSEQSEHREMLSNDPQLKALRLRLYVLCSQCARFIDIAQGDRPQRGVEGVDLVRHEAEEHARWLKMLSIIE